MVRKVLFKLGYPSPLIYYTYNRMLKGLIGVNDPRPLIPAGKGPGRIPCQTDKQLPVSRSQSGVWFFNILGCRNAVLSKKCIHTFPNISAGPSTTRTSIVAPTLSTSLSLNAKRRDSLPDASNPASVRAPQRRESVVPPMNGFPALRIPPYQSSLAAPNAAGVPSPGWNGSVAPSPGASSSVYAKRGPPPAVSNDAGVCLPQSPSPAVLPASGGPGAPPPGVGLSLGATPDPSSPAASNSAGFSSPLSPGPVPGSTMARKMTKLRPYQRIPFSS